MGDTQVICASGVAHFSEPTEAFIDPLKGPLTQAESHMWPFLHNFR
jgi:hypothetical protein